MAKLAFSGSDYYTGAAAHHLLGYRHVKSSLGGHHFHFPSAGEREHLTRVRIAHQEHGVRRRIPLKRDPLSRTARADQITGVPES
jgi:hypothetical protein